MTFERQPRLEAPLRLAFGKTYQRLSSQAEALEQFQQAYALYLSEYGPRHRDSLVALTQIGSAQRLLSRYDEAETSLLEAAGIIWEEVEPEDESYHTIHLSLALLYKDTGRLELAEAHCRRALLGARKNLGEGSELAIKAGHRLGVLLSDLGQFEESEEILRDSLKASMVALGPEHDTSRLCGSGLGVFLLNRGRFEEAVEELRRALGLERKLSGDLGSNTLATMGNLGNALARVGETEEAEGLMREALEGNLRARGPHHRDTQLALHSLGSLLQATNRREEALPLLGEAFAIGAEKENPSTTELYSRLAYGVCLFQTTQVQEAWEVLEPAPGLFFEVLGSHPNTLACVSAALNVAYAVKDQEALAALAAMGLELHEQLGQPISKQQEFALLSHRSMALGNLQQDEEAREASVAVVQFAKENFPDDSALLANSLLSHASLLLRMNELEGAEAQLTELEEMLAPLGGIPQDEYWKVLDLRERLAARPQPASSTGDSDED